MTTAPSLNNEETLTPIFIKHTTDAISNPFFELKVRLDTKSGQHIMARAFRRASFSLFSIDVILRIISQSQKKTDDNIDEVDKIINGYLDEEAKALENLHLQLEAVMKQANLNETIDYSLPQLYIVEVSSPQVKKLANIISHFDELMKMVDSLWMNGNFDNKQRTQMSHEWKSRVFKLTTKIIQLEKRARANANKDGLEESVIQAVGPDMTDDVDLENETSSATAVA